MDPSYGNQSLVNKELIEIMELCWEHDGDKRVEIFTIVERLRKLARKVENNIPEQSEKRWE
jgi:hypothetical protein